MGSTLVTRQQLQYRARAPQKRARQQLKGGVKLCNQMGHDMTDHRRGQINGACRKQAHITLQQQCEAGLRSLTAL